MIRTRFPALFQRILVAKETTQSNIVRAIAHSGYRLSRQFMSLIAKGQRSVPPLQLNRICEALKLDPAEQAELHRAAALDHGYQIETHGDKIAAELSKGLQSQWEKIAAETFASACKKS